MTPPALILSFKDLAMGSSLSSGNREPLALPPATFPPVFDAYYCNLALSAAALSSYNFLFLSSSAYFFFSASSLRFLSYSSFLMRASSFFLSSSYFFFSISSLLRSSAAYLSAVYLPLVEFFADSLESLRRLGVGLGY